MDESIAEICAAIHGHRLLGFTYREMERTVQPYAYGVDAGGHPVLRAYQVAGESRTGVPAWKLFRIEEVTDLRTLEESFLEPREGYMRNDPAMTKVYCEL